MPEPTINDIFGANASQNNDFLIVKKSDLSDLVASELNTGEALGLALIKLASQYCNSNQKTLNPDLQITIEYKGQSTGFNSQEFGMSNFIQDFYLITFSKPYFYLPDAINPMDY